MSEKGGRGNGVRLHDRRPIRLLGHQESHNTLAFGHRRTGAQDIFIPISSLRFERTEERQEDNIKTYQPQALRVVLSDEDGNVYGLRYEFASGGSITLLAGSAMLTNYGLSAPEWRGLSRPILADLDNRPVCFVNAQYLYDKEESTYTNHSVLSFFVERPPLRLALWIPVGMGLMALLFNTPPPLPRRTLSATPAQFVAAFVHQ